MIWNSNRLEINKYKEKAIALRKKNIAAALRALKQLLKIITLDQY